MKVVGAVGAVVQIVDTVQVDAMSAASLACGVRDPAPEFAGELPGTPNPIDVDVAAVVNMPISRRKARRALVLNVAYAPADPAVVLVAPVS